MLVKEANDTKLTKKTEKKYLGAQGSMAEMQKSMIKWTMIVSKFS